MTVLDQGQRYLRLDEVDGSPIVNVIEGVTFIDVGLTLVMNIHQQE